MKKIKSVKLKNDYRSNLNFIPAKTELIKDSFGRWELIQDSAYVLCLKDDSVLSNETDLFEIEYEEETSGGQQYLDVRITIGKFWAFKTIMDRHLPRHIKKAFKQIGIDDVKVTETGRGKL